MPLAKQHLDPAALAGRYPALAKTPLPPGFVAPKLTRQQESSGSGAGALLVLGGFGLVALWLTSRGGTSRSRGD